MPTFSPHVYQKTAINFLLSRLWLDDEQGAGLFLDPGLGKTSITLETLWQMKRQHLFKRALIVAPLRVMYLVWPDEIKKWRYPFTYSIIHGPAAKRKNELLKDTDIHLINPEGLAWLAKLHETRSGRHLKYDWLIVDESTKFKNWSAGRSKALRKLLPLFNRRMILTGTPAPNSYTDLPSQSFICDDGKALGKTISAFRSNFCTRHTGVAGQQVWEVPAAVRPTIESRLAPLVLRMNCEDYLDMPERVDNFVKVDLPPKIRRAYDEIEAQMFAELDGGSRLEASNAGAKYVLCRQIANGGAYEDDDLFGGRRTIHAHDEKTEAVVEIVEELSGKPVLVAYQFQHDAERLSRAFPKAPIIRGGMSPKESTALIGEWNEGRHPVFLVQPQALSHGANMQAGGADLIWHGHTDQLEIFIQFNARLWRQGQGKQVRFHHVMAEDTVDTAVWGRLQDKTASQDALLNALQGYRETRL